MSDSFLSSQHPAHGLAWSRCLLSVCGMREQERGAGGEEVKGERDGGRRVNWGVQTPERMRHNRGRWEHHHPTGRGEGPEKGREGWVHRCGPWFLRVEGPWAPGLTATPIPDVLPPSPTRRHPLGPGEPSPVPDCGARACPHPAEPGGRRVGQLWAPGHRPGCHQLADSGTGLSSWLVAPSPWGSLLGILPAFCWPFLPLPGSALGAELCLGSVGVCWEAEGPRPPLGPSPCPTPPRAAALGHDRGPEWCLLLSVEVKLGSLSSRWYPGSSCAEGTAILDAGLFKQRGGGRLLGPALPHCEPCPHLHPPGHTPGSILGGRREAWAWPPAVFWRHLPSVSIWLDYQFGTSCHQAWSGALGQARSQAGPG